MPRFYCPHPLDIGANVPLPEPVARHLHVLRMAPGQALTLFNGQGGEFAAQLATLDKKSGTALIMDYSARDSELPYRLTLMQALPEGSKMDWIIEKAVELGVTAIQPLAAQRCVVRLSAERAAKRHQHWQGIIVAASEQCGRNRLAEMSEVEDLARWSALASPQQRLLLTPRAEHSLTAWAGSHEPQAAALLVGPEGGFSENEEAMLIARGALPVSMGPRILRTETAGLAAVAILNAIWGQM